MSNGCYFLTFDGVIDAESKDNADYIVLNIIRDTDTTMVYKFDVQDLILLQFDC